jgi:hypothetical protein
VRTGSASTRFREEIEMTKGQKSGRRELKPSLVGHKVPARRAGEGSNAANRPAEVGQDVDCALPDSGLVRDASPREKGRDDLGKRARPAHKPR